MRLDTERVTENGRYWKEICALDAEAFPEAEYMAPADILKMTEDGAADFLALSDGGRFVGFMVVKLYGSLTYLFFLAIDPSCRRKGYGSRAIETLRDLYPGRCHTVDFERIEDNAPNLLQRKKRKQFYLRNGFHETGLFLSYLGVNYEVMCAGETFPEGQFREMMNTIAKGAERFHPRYFRKGECDENKKTQGH